MHDQARRDTGVGRWMPVGFYIAIVLGWLIDGMLAGAGDRLWLVVLTVPAPALYIWRTRVGRA